MPYFHLKQKPAYPRIYQITLILPHQTHLGAENALFLRKKTAPGTESNFLSVGPERTGNPSKNPQKHLKKPLPPVRCTADGREEGGWLGWLG